MVLHYWLFISGLSMFLVGITRVIKNRDKYLSIFWLILSIAQLITAYALK